MLASGATGAGEGTEEAVAVSVRASCHVCAIAAGWCCEAVDNNDVLFSSTSFRRLTSSRCNPGLNLASHNILIVTLPCSHQVN